MIRAKELLPLKQVERAGAAQPEEKVPGRTYGNLPGLKGVLQESWRGTLYSYRLRL